MMPSFIASWYCRYGRRNVGEREHKGRGGGRGGKRERMERGKEKEKDRQGREHMLRCTALTGPET